MAPLSSNMTWNGPALEGLTVAAARAGTAAAAETLQKRIKLNLSRPGAPNSPSSLSTLTRAFHNLGFALTSQVIKGKAFSVIRGTLSPLRGRRAPYTDRKTKRAEDHAQSLLDSEHNRGNVFVDPPGGMPRKRSGDLRRSIIIEEEPDSMLVGAASVYGAIHEFGGMAGRGGKVKIPARPYIRPSLNQSSIEMFDAFIANAKRVMGGG